MQFVLLQILSNAIDSEELEISPVHAMMLSVDEIFEKYDEAAKIEGIISL